MIRQLQIGGYNDNFSYFIIDGKDVAIVDPDNVTHLVAEMEQEMLVPKMILLTHSHFDHCAGAAELASKYGIPVYMHKNARDRVDIHKHQIVTVEDGEKIKLGELHIEVLHTPGHIDDAVCYLVGDCLLTGDTLFVEGCGHAKLEGANVEDLWKSLQRIAALGDDIKVYPGHDYGSKPHSTVGYEKKHNKYLKCKDFEEFNALRND